MKLRKIPLMISVLTLNIILTSCCSSQKVSCAGSLENIDFSTFTGIWCDENTFIISTEGKYKKNITDPVKRKASSKDEAIFSAQYLILEKFQGSCINGACGINTQDDSRFKAYSDEILRVAKSGTVIQEKWDGSLNCRILYMISRPGLKQIVKRCSLD